MGLKVPYNADPVATPWVVYGEEFNRIEFLLDDEETWRRVTFENLDSLRISRGEYLPYKDVVDSSADWNKRWPWVFEVENSPWLLERYAYEAKHYGDAYNFGGDVDEMLRDFRHYVFAFHDEFVEAIAAGIWLDPCPENPDEPGTLHPLVDLTASAITERFVGSGITCQIRTNPRPVEDLIADARLCSQKLYQFAAELDGDASPSWTFRIRIRRGRLRGQLLTHFDRVVEEFDGLVSPDDVRPTIYDWLEEVSKRRREMGKT